MMDRRGPLEPPWVIGIDPSLTGTGIAVPTGATHKIGRPGITGLGWDAKEDAIEGLVREIMMVVGAQAVDAVVMEALDVAARYGGLIERVWLWLEIRRQCRARRIPLLVASSSQRLGYLTGKGSGSKGVVVENVTRLLPDADIRGDDNRADALVFMMMGMDKLGHPVVALPQKNRDWLDRCYWTSEAPPPKKIKTIRKATVLSAE